MTPRDVLELIKGQGQEERVLWREPGGDHYLLARGSEDARYRAEGYQRQCTLWDLRRQFAEMPAEGIRPGSELWQLLEDLNRQEG